jgi:hypothetical protein
MTHQERSELIDYIMEAVIGEGIASNIAHANADIADAKINLSQAKTDRIKANPLNKINIHAYQRRAGEHISRKVQGVKSKVWRKVGDAV